MSQSIQNIFKMMLKTSNSFLLINKARRSSLRQNWPFAILLQAGACFTDQMQLAICDRSHRRIRNLASENKETCIQKLACGRSESANAEGGSLPGFARDNSASLKPQ